MEAVIKVGGSIAEKPAVLKKLGDKLGEIAEKHSIVVVPGGGKLADVVRELDQQYGLSADVAHKMAILGMDQFGLLLSQVIPNSCTTYSLSEAKTFSEGKSAPIFLPSQLMFRENPLEASWDVTSDSIAAYFASQLNANMLILATDVDGIFESDPKKQLDNRLLFKLSANELLAFTQRSSVDLFLPKLLMKMRLDCYVVNGCYPERVAAILSGQCDVCTLIKA